MVLNSNQNSPSLIHLPWIDALRGMAFFGVLFYHIGLSTESFPSILMNINELGQSGVQLFYVVSAFTLFMSMKSRNEQETAPLRNFFIRRFFRIAPLFYCVITYNLLHHGVGPNLWKEDGISITLLNVFSHFTFLNGWNPYWINTLVPGGWSIAIEMPFYCLAPLLFKRIKTVESAVWLTLGLFLFNRVLSLLLKKFVLKNDSGLLNEFLYYWLLNQLPIFILGIILYFLILEKADNLRNDTSSFLLHSLKIMSPLLLAGLGLSAFMIVAKINPNRAVLFQGVGIGFVYLALLLNSTPFPLIVNRFWCYLGQISYSAYLLHFEVYPLARSGVLEIAARTGNKLLPILEFTATLMISLGGTVALATLTYRLIEQPGISLGKRLIKHLEAKAFT